MKTGTIITTDKSFLPTKGSDQATCYDFVLTENIEIAPGEIFLAGTGVKTNFASKVYARSSLAIKKKLLIPNSVGVIDADYRGEIKVPLYNFGNETVKLKKGERLAQMEIDIFIENILLLIDSDLYEKWDNQTNRGAGGFGSTGGYKK